MANTSPYLVINKSLTLNLHYKTRKTIYLGNPKLPIVIRLRQQQWGWEELLGAGEGERTIAKRNVVSFWESRKREKERERTNFHISEIHGWDVLFVFDGWATHGGKKTFLRTAASETHSPNMHLYLLYSKWHIIHIISKFYVLWK